MDMTKRYGPAFAHPTEASELDSQSKVRSGSDSDVREILPSPTDRNRGITPLQGT